MKKREMSNQLDWIATAIQFWSLRVHNGIYTTTKNRYKVRDIAQKRIMELYIHIHKVKSNLDWSLERTNRNSKISRETKKWEKANRWTCTHCGTIVSPYHEYCTKWECRKPKINL